MSDSYDPCFRLFYVSSTLFYLNSHTKTFPYAKYFEHLRGEKDAIARKAAAEKRKLEAEIVELRRKCAVRDGRPCRRRDGERKKKILFQDRRP